MWRYTGTDRPPFAEDPGPDQESVWDYPRPPALVATDEIVEVGIAPAWLATTRRALRVLETASPPTYYIPAADVAMDELVLIEHGSFCEWKGEASYFALNEQPDSAPVAWRYRNPSQRFANLHDHISFYPGRIACYVNGERVVPQPGGFYGGWITSRIAGPVKGSPGTGHW